MTVTHVTRDIDFTVTLGAMPALTFGSRSIPGLGARSSLPWRPLSGTIEPFLFSNPVQCFEIGSELRELRSFYRDGVAVSVAKLDAVDLADCEAMQAGFTKHRRAQLYDPCTANINKLVILANYDVALLIASHRDGALMGNHLGVIAILIEGFVRCFSRW